MLSKDLQQTSQKTQETVPFLSLNLYEIEKHWHTLQASPINSYYKDNKTPLIKNSLSETSYIRLSYLLQYWIGNNQST